MKNLGILKPAKFRNLELKNRICWLPAVSVLAGHDDGYLTDALIDRHVKRAKGGFGLIDVEACGINTMKSPGLLRLVNEEQAARHKVMTDAVHEYGCKMTVQLIHYVKQSVKTGWKFPIEDFTKEEILGIEDEFVNAIVLAKKAGYDGVELHVAHGYTLSSFISNLNKRTDEYGRGIEGKCRIVTEIMAKAREAVGEDYCIGCRISGEEFVNGGNTLKHTTRIAQIFAEAGMDFISVSAGGKTEDGAWYKGYSGNRCMPPEYYPYGLHVYLADGIKRALREIGSDIPVIVSGKIDTLERGQEIFTNGQADIIGYCRPGICDPEFVNKSAGINPEPLIKCVYCNTCLERDQRHEPVNCIVWEKVCERKGVDPYEPLYKG